MKPTMLLIGLLALQLLLGLGSYVNRFTSLEIPYSAFTRLALPTTHRITGALILAVCTVLTLRASRLLASSEVIAGERVFSEQVRA
jgi:hypothetical protein